MHSYYKIIIYAKTNGKATTIPMNFSAHLHLKAMMSLSTFICQQLVAQTAACRGVTCRLYSCDVPRCVAYMCVLALVHYVRDLIQDGGLVGFECRPLIAVLL